ARFAVTYLSSGEILRKEVAAGTALGQEVAADLAAGDLVPDDLMLEVLRAPLEAALTSGGYVLDGFPRNVAQALELAAYAAQLGGAPEAAVWFDVEDAELLRRTRIRVYAAATAPLIDYYRAQHLLIRIDAAKPVDEVTAVVLAALEPFVTMPN